MTKNQKLILTGLAVEYALKTLHSTKQDLHARVIFEGGDGVQVASCLISNGETINYPASFQTAEALSRKVKIESLAPLDNILSESISAVIVEDIRTSSYIKYPRIINGSFVGDYLTRLKQQQEVDYDAWTAAVKNALNEKELVLPKNQDLSDVSQAVSNTQEKVNVYNSRGVSQGTETRKVVISYNPLGFMRSVWCEPKTTSDIKKGMIFEYLSFIHYISSTLDANKGANLANYITLLIRNELGKCGGNSRVTLVKLNNGGYLDIHIGSNANLEAAFSEGFATWLAKKLGVKFFKANQDWISYAGFKVDATISSIIDSVANYGKSLTSADKEVLVKVILGGFVFDKLYGSDIYNSIVENNKKCGNYFSVFSILAMNSVLLLTETGVKSVVTNDLQQLFNTKDSVNYYLQPVVTGPNVPKGLALYPVSNFGEVYSEAKFGSVPVSSGVFSFGATSYQSYIESIAKDVSVSIAVIDVYQKDAVSLGNVENRLFQTSDYLLQVVNNFSIGVITDTIISKIGANGLHKNPFVQSQKFKPDNWYSLGEIMNDNTVISDIQSEDTVQRETALSSQQLYDNSVKMSRMRQYQTKVGNDVSQSVDLFVDMPDQGIQQVDSIKELNVGG